MTKTKDKPSNGYRRTKQCSACPWKKSSSLRDIPNYDPERHARLASCTGVAPGGGMMVMACHESPPGDEYACVGWLHNQLGEGGNLTLRLAVAMGNVRVGKLVLDGEQFGSLKEMSEREE